jgi:hypothetical protein
VFFGPEKAMEAAANRPAALFISGLFACVTTTRETH